MSKIKGLLLMLLCIVICGAMKAQNNTNSPYTRYGYGELADPVTANSKAMGGVAYALRDKMHINFANPASYTAVDSLTFIFDGGVSLQNTNFSDGLMKKNAKNSSFDYVTMEFRAAKWMGISLGLLPYSNIGYNLVGITDGTDDTPANNVTYTGEGGLHQLYFGAGFKLVKNLSVGANIAYLWGDFERGKAITFSSSTLLYNYAKSMNVAVKSYKLDLGAQYTLKFAKKHDLTLGAIFSPGHEMNSDAGVYDQLGNDDMGYTTTERDTVLKCGIPTTIGFGLAYMYDNRLTVGVDGTLQNWNDVYFLNEKNVMCKRAKVSVGAEYYPNPMGRTFFSHVRYRLGAYISKPYYKVDGERAAKEFGLTAGFGIPLPKSRSLVNLSAQYVHLKGQKTDFLTENTFRICVGVTFNERWFFKRKVD